MKKSEKLAIEIISAKFRKKGMSERGIRNGLTWIGLFMRALIEAEFLILKGKK